VNLWRLLHITCMFGAVAVLAGGGLVRNAVLHTGDVAAIRRTIETEERLANRLGAPLLLAGIAFGLATAVQMGYPLLSPWLVIAYVLMALNILNGTVYARHATRIAAAAAASTEDAPSTQLATLIRARPTWTLNAIDALLWLALIYTMVRKPFA
jgi:uncharacterized membrane protein